MLAIEPLPLYLETPSVGLSTSEVEAMAGARLRLLVACPLHIPLGGVACDAGALSSDLTLNAGFDVGDLPYIDAVGHFTLRLAFSEPRALREWFVQKELRVFRLRWAAASEDVRAVALTTAGLVCSVDTAPDELPGTVGATRSLAVSVPFTSVPPVLIAQRRVVLRHGKALLSTEDAGCVIGHLFEIHLRAALDLATAGAHHVQSHVGFCMLVERLRACGEQIVAREEREALPEATIDGNGGRSDFPRGDLTLSNFEEQLQQSFPPCMRHMVLSQRRGQHLKDQGRLQLRFFLRQAGLPLASALQWWKVELTRDPVIDAHSFSKNYAYAIEHAYGQRGASACRAGFGCAKIIQLPFPKVHEVHGCPFKIFSSGQLQAALETWGVAPGARPAIWEAALAGECTKACSLCFDSTHPGSKFSGHIRHPNAYLRWSRAHYAACTRG